MDKVKITRLAAKWCKEKGVGETPLNIIYALESLGYLKEAAQQSVQRIGGYAGPSEHGTYPGHEDGCVCGLCESTPANR